MRKDNGFSFKKALTKNVNVRNSKITIYTQNQNIASGEITTVEIQKKTVTFSRNTQLPLFGGRHNN